MMPGARFFFYSTSSTLSSTLSSPMGGHESRLQSVLRRAAVLPIRPVALTLEPVLVLLAVGHGGTFERAGLI
jgi:hypothetical protein